MEQKDCQQSLACGIDLVEYESLTHYIDLAQERFLQRIFTAHECAYCSGRIPCLAARFAAKEAVSKALGTGMRGVRFTEIEIRNDDRGKPLLYLSGHAASVAEELQLSEWSISISHAEHYTVAIAVALRRGMSIHAEITDTISDILKTSLERPNATKALLAALDEANPSITMEGRK